MHGAVLDWARELIPAHGLTGRSVLEVGSLDVNGSVRSMFTGPYVGVDFREGPGVDAVMNGHDLRFPDASFDVVVSTEMIEHDSEFWLSLLEMGRVLRRGGHLLLTTRGNGFQEHGYPEDYWRFMPSSSDILLAVASCDRVSVTLDPEAPGLLIHGVRR